MKRFLGLSAVVFIGFVLIISGVIVVTRRLDLPADLRNAGFGWCDGVNCLTKSSGITELNVRPISVAWIVAWLGGPCDVQMTSFGATLRFSTAYVYAYSKPDHIRPDDKIWAIIILPNARIEPCDRTEPTWHGFAQDDEPADPFAGPNMP